MSEFCGLKDSVGNECALLPNHSGRCLKRRTNPVGHHCHARGCEIPTKPEILMCLAHWRKVPKELQRAVWRHYRAGQCDDKQPSKEWHAAADAAIKAVAEKEAARKPKQAGLFE